MVARTCVSWSLLGAVGAEERCVTGERVSTSKRVEEITLKISSISIVQWSPTMFLVLSARLT